MFTLEESELLARMLRVLGWMLLCVLVSLTALFAYRWHLLQRVAALLGAAASGALPPPLLLHRLSRLASRRILLPPERPASGIGR